MISLVDDDPDVLAATACLLRSLGYKVQAFECGQTLLGWSGLADIRCIIADVMMPKINGFELQHRLASQGFQAPVIFLTANYDQMTKERLIRNGAYDVLPKPCEEQRLVNCLKAALKHHHQPHVVSLPSNNDAPPKPK